MSLWLRIAGLLMAFSACADFIAGKGAQASVETAIAVLLFFVADLTDE